MRQEGKSKYCKVDECRTQCSATVLMFEDFSFAGDEMVIHDAEWRIEDGILTVEGYEDNVMFAETKTLVEELEYEPHESSVRHFGGIRLFGFELLEPCDYVYGYWRTVQKRKVKYVLKNFSLKEINGQCY